MRPPPMAPERRSLRQIQRPSPMVGAPSLLGLRGTVAVSSVLMVVSLVLAGSAFSVALLAYGHSGTRGPTGPPGTNGAQGPVGANGTRGASGANGSQGTPGIQGTPGQNGSNGPPGLGATVNQSIVDSLAVISPGTPCTARANISFTFGGAGTLVASATVSGGTNHSFTAYFTTAELNLANSSTDCSSDSTIVGEEAQEPVGNYVLSVSLGRAFPISSGGTQIFYVDILNTSNDTLMGKATWDAFFVYRITLVGVFYPA